MRDVPAQNKKTSTSASKTSIKASKPGVGHKWCARQGMHKASFDIEHDSKQQPNHTCKEEKYTYGHISIKYNKGGVTAVQNTEGQWNDVLVIGFLWIFSDLTLEMTFPWTHLLISTLVDNTHTGRVHSCVNMCSEMFGVQNSMHLFSAVRRGYRSKPCTPSSLDLHLSNWQQQKVGK